MSTKSLWGDLEDVQTVRTPKVILEEQANILTELTKGKLVGKVEQYSYSGNSFGYELEIEVPSLNNYTYLVLGVQHEITLYPVSIFVNGEDFSTCKDEQEFEKSIGKALSSSGVKKVISSLLSQVS